MTFFVTMNYIFVIHTMSYFYNNKYAIKINKTKVFY